MDAYFMLIPSHPLLKQMENPSRKYPNALILTVILYANGLVELAVNTSTDARTLLSSLSSTLTDLVTLPHARW